MDDYGDDELPSPDEQTSTNEGSSTRDTNFNEFVSKQKTYLFRLYW